MSQINGNVLATAKDEYTTHLKNRLIPLIYEGFVSLYEDAKIKENEKPEFNYNYLKQFQMLLKDIPYWNQSILEEETRRIQNKFGFLMELLAGVFLSYIKILASIRLKGDGDNIKIKLPHTEVFIHTVYTKASEYIYYNPRAFSNYHLRENQMYICETIGKSIDDTINSMIPIENILREYLSNVFSGNVKNTEEFTKQQTDEIPFSAILNSKDLENTTNDMMIPTSSEIDNKFSTDDNKIDNDTLVDDYTVGGKDPFEVENENNDDPFGTSGVVDNATADTKDPFGPDEVNSVATETKDLFGSDKVDNITETKDLFNDNAPIPPELNKDDMFFSGDNTSIKFKEDLL